MCNRKSSFIMLIALSMGALLSGCGSSSKDGNIGGVAKIGEDQCRTCHAASTDSVSKTSIVTDYLVSSHYTLPDGEPGVGCQGCHGGGAQHNSNVPIPYKNPFTSGRCSSTECHGTKIPAFVAADFVGKCAPCHTTSGVGGIHAAHVTSDPDNCVDCHDVAAPQHGNGVNDNNGVRAIVAEFSKWSHHVVGVALQPAHCAACHLEGKVEDGKIKVDKTYHMADAKTHLRNADTDADMLWDPSAPNHSTMDNFCMSCHDSNGAKSSKSAAIRALIIPAAGKTASAANPFGDTISNRYDKMQRPAVVDASSQFNTGNASHHAVKGPKYTGRTRTAGPRRIASAATFAANSSATLWGKRSTIYDSVNAITGVKETANAAFNNLYVPLENAGGEAAPRTGAATLGDDSTLHCGDCHTVGQWKPGVATNAKGQLNTVAIGAHGSNNEYLLRNSIGTDERHTQDAYVTTAGNVALQNPNAAFLVCFNCHSYSRYGSVYNATGATGPHAGEYDAAGRCNGVGNTIPFNGYTTGKATDGTQFESRLGVNMVTIPPASSITINGKTYTNANATNSSTVNVALSTFAATPAFAPGFPLNFAKAPGGVQASTYTGEQESDFGNIFGIQCANCHNSGVDGGYGGIHGSTVSTYTDGMGNTNTKRRFLPGLGNVMHVPGTLGGFTGTTLAHYSSNTRNPVGFHTYDYETGGTSNETNWEQVQWNFNGSATAAGVGAGCYTLTEVSGKASSGITGQSVDGGATIPEAFGTWGGCDDHGAAQGGGDHGFVKRINRPVTY